MFLIIMAGGDEDDKAVEDDADDGDGDVPPIPNGERRHQLRHSRR